MCIRDSYDLLLEPRDANCSERTLQAFVIAFDEQLSALNMEFAHKRKSKRLHLPRLHHMRQGWSTAHQRADVANGKRDGQYKWPYVRNEWHAISESFVLNTLDAMSPTEADTAD